MPSYVLFCIPTDVNIKMNMTEFISKLNEGPKTAGLILETPMISEISLDNCDPRLYD